MSRVPVFFIIFLSLDLSKSQGNDTCPFEVVTDLDIQDCMNNRAYFTEKNCIPYCQLYPKGNPTSQCRNCDDYPGFRCSTNKCEPDPQYCIVYYIKTTQNTYTKSLFKPTCQKDSRFAPRQCKGEKTTGRCYCSDELGNRIFGHQWANLADDMTCLCSRRRAVLGAADSSRFVSLHCDYMGNYEPLQCDVESSQCWCVEPKTGELTSAVVPDKAMNRLPCYDQDQMGGQYLRQCDSWKYAQNKILNELSRHGTNNISFVSLLCDGDGAYGHYSLSDGAAYCTWRDNSRIKAWQSPTAGTDLTKLNCNCARDSILFAMAGKDKIQQCLGNGNYNSYQQVGNVAYCVDSDGYRDSDRVPQNKEDCDV